jgi:hypothetical protein
MYLYFHLEFKICCIHIQSSLDCRANVEQFNHQCFERSAKICEPLDIEVKKPRICGRQIMRDIVEADTGTCHLLCSLVSSELNLRFLRLCLCQVISLVVFL